jgi:2-amino-4-hydroxy-6-hydroxymethyldihydropteridine diphosphokinase
VDRVDAEWRTAAVAAGSNLGDRASHLAFARRRLEGLLQDLVFSSVFETEPHGVTVRQENFLNAAAVGQTRASARELVAALLEIERERGRERPFERAPRTLDLDLILLGDAIVSEPGVIVPHPRFRERRFVLEPLAEIAPHLVDPVTGQSVERLLQALPG